MKNEEQSDVTNIAVAPGENPRQAQRDNVGTETNETAYPSCAWEETDRIVLCI